MSPDHNGLGLNGAEPAVSRHTATRLALGALQPAAAVLIGRIHAQGHSNVGAYASSTAAKVNHAAIWQHVDPPRRRHTVRWTMIDHDLHHGGEIGVLRDLYRERNMSPTRVPASGARA